MTEHWSDCALNSEPAFPSGPCNCGGLKLAEDCLEGGIVALVTPARGVRFLVKHMGREGFVGIEDLKALPLAAFASASNLPDGHTFTLLSYPDSMNLHDAREAVISQLKTLARKSKGK